MYTKTIEIKDIQFYNSDVGFGLVDMIGISNEVSAAQALHAGGWTLRRAYAKDYYESILANESGIYTKDFRNVLIYRVDVPEFGTYRVSVKCMAPSGGISDMALFSGRRNLFDSGINVPEGITYEKDFFINVTPYIPALSYVPCEEKAIYISICGKNAGLSQITISKEDFPVLYMAGDSTLTDQNALTPFYPYKSCGGWAQFMSQYFENIAVCNYAHSGLTSNCFLDDGHWDILTRFLKKNDIVMIQFGHNDQKRRNLAAFTGYLNSLRWYIKKIREFGAIPIICSPISRIPFWDDETKKYCSLLSDHALAAKKAADDLSAPFIDLHTLTFDRWVSLGENDVHDYFCDSTHTNEYGGRLIARIVANEIKRQKITPLTDYLCYRTLPPFTPDMDTKEVPVEPAGFNMFDIKPPYMDIKDIPQYEGIKKAFKAGLLDPCIMHLHPEDSLPRAQVLMPLFKALRLEGSRPYHGKYVDINRYEWDSSFIERCIKEKLIDENTIKNDRFRPDDPLTALEFASLCERGLIKDIKKREIDLTASFTKAKEDNIIPHDTGENDILCRADIYSGLAEVSDLLGNEDKALPKDAEIHPV